MKHNIFRQAIYEMRSQPVVGTVSLLATALSLFLVMAVMMMDRAAFAEFAPVSNRDRILYGKHLHVQSTDDKGEDSSSAMSAKMARRLFMDLKTPEKVALISDSPESVMLYLPGKQPDSYDLRYADSEVWSILDYRFLAGGPYTADQTAAGAKVAVLSAKAAEAFFGTPEKAVGQTLYVGSNLCRVVGVVEEVSPLADEAYAQVWLPLTPKAINNGDDRFGNIMALVLARSADDFRAIRNEVNTRKQILDKELRAENLKLVDHGSPFTRMEAFYVRGSNGDSDAPLQRRVLYLLYAILLLIPAINLSGMTQSRLRRRITEIGVRRAFGATRTDIMLSLLAENFVVTAIGGILALVCCFLFAIFFSDAMFSSYTRSGGFIEGVPVRILFSWTFFGSALAACFVLNLLSTGIPAWRAAKTAPVKAINNSLS